MGYKALLTLDLENSVSAEKRGKFYESLDKKQWTKLSDLTTAWKCSFNDDVTREAAIRVVKRDVANAAEYAGVYSYTAAVQVGKGLIEKF